jgi:glycosyltransferase involved in cell wall biosynthesis
MGENNMTSPAISVVFTSYNHREYLCQALDAIINQTFKDFELIIVDDCSTDGSQDLLKIYAQKDKRIKLFLNEKNSGSYVLSTNYGASLAKGKYILFAQCDDYSELTQLETLYNIAVSHPKISLIFSASNMVDENNNVLGSDFDVRSRSFRNKCCNDTIITKELFQKFIFESCVVPNLSAALFSRELFESIGGLDAEYLVVADWDIYFKISCVSDIYYIRKELNNFRQHSTTIRNSIKLESQMKEMKTLFYNLSKLSIPFYNIAKIRKKVIYLWLSFLRKSPKNWFIAINNLLPIMIKEDKSFAIHFVLCLCCYPFKVIKFRLFH